MVWSMDMSSRMPRGVGVRRVDLPARRVSTQRQAVGRIAVDLVGGREDEDGVRAHSGAWLRAWLSVPLALTAKSVSGSSGGPVVRRLGGGVDHQRHILAETPEQPVHASRVADVGVEVAVAAGQLALEASALAVRGGLVAEEATAHVIVHADHVEAGRGEVPRSFGTNQTGRAGNHGDAHGFIPPRSQVLEPFMRPARRPRQVAARS